MARKFLLILLAGAIVAGTADAAGRGPAPVDASAALVTSDQDLQVQLLDAINAVRRSHGLRELQLNRGLSVAALAHTQSMAKLGFFAHEDRNGSPFWTRIKARYQPVRGHTWGVAENLAWASPALGAEQAVQLWLDSPPHRKNLLAASWREVGLGAVHASDAPGVYDGLDVTIVTADFGVR